MSKKHRLFSDINSSFTIFYVLLVPLWAYIFSTYFPEVLRTQALLLCIIFPLALYIFKFAIFQLIEGTDVLKMIVLYACVIAGMNFLSAVTGPLADGTIPVISYQLLGAKLYTYTGPTYLTASVFIFYGMTALVCALACAAFLELLYTKLYRYLPLTVRRTLQRADNSVDTTSASVVARLFYTTEFRGLLAASSVVIAYGVIYTVVVLAT